MVGRRDSTPQLIRDDASETERPSLERTQQRIVAFWETANFQYGSEIRLCATCVVHAAHFHILVSIRALSGASRRQNFGSVPLQFYLDGGIPGIEDPPALRFRGATKQDWARRETK